MSVFAGGMFPLMAFAAPSAAHAATKDDLSNSEVDYLNTQKAQVIADSALLESAQLELNNDMNERRTLREAMDDHELRDYWVDGDHYIEYRDNHPALREEYDDLGPVIQEDRKEVERANSELHYDANEYRGHLHNDGLSVPEWLPFIPEPA